jgi:beta-N-acetylhexosaminidase
VYSVPVPGRRAPALKDDAAGDSAVVADPSGALLQQILDRAAPKTAVLAMGSPYLAKDLPQVKNYLCTFSNTTVSEVSAVKALFGEIAIHGHLPVNIPGIADRGAGMERPAKVAQGGN